LETGKMLQSDAQEKRILNIVGDADAGEFDEKCLC
jgi:hypothetical protein